MVLTRATAMMATTLATVTTSAMNTMWTWHATAVAMNTATVPIATSVKTVVVNMHVLGKSQAGDNVEMKAMKLMLACPHGCVQLALFWPGWATMVTKPLLMGRCVCFSIPASHNREHKHDNTFPGMVMTDTVVVVMVVLCFFNAGVAIVATIRMLVVQVVTCEATVKITAY